MTQSQIDQMARDIAEGLKPFVLELLASGALSAIKPATEMDKIVTHRELWALLHGLAPHQLNGGKSEFLWKSDNDKKPNANT
jgi:hypothetical protein